MDSASPMFEPARDGPPGLPVPTRERWQPLRIGLVELFHYDAEEFWFRDGHLLLRGNNGTGKSKVLSLTLPFLLDASLSASRVEPDGDRSKRMEWNLLVGRYERRTGYTWIELGRLDAEGRAHFLTLGCGLSAVAGRGRVDAWHFTTDQRIGVALHLISPERTAMSRDRLEAALEGHGRIFDTVRDYRREVDARLFRLGERYDGLIDTLIQLRQPQLSKRPDEQNLSDALSNALPELPRALLEDVAVAMNQLDEYRDELQQIEQVRGAVADFGKRYRVYAQIQARRQARVLRQAQTELDNQSRALHEAEAQLQAASDGAAQCQERAATLELQIVRERATLDELRADPTMQDARRLADLEEAAQHAEREQRVADQRFAHAEAQLAREQRELQRRSGEHQHAQQHASRCGDEASQDAVAAGILEHALAWTRLSPVPEPAVRAREQRELAAAIERRGRQISAVRELIARCDKAEQAHERAESTCADRRASHERAEQDALAADLALSRQGEALVSAWRAYLAGLSQLRLDEPETGLAELAAWVESMAFEQPLRLQLRAAEERARAGLAAELSEVAHEQQALARDDEALAREQAALEAGGQLTPVQLPMRAYAERVERPGAPLWQLLEFRDHVPDEARAGLEAALEGAGLLDAWVSPEAHVLRSDSDDAWLVPGPPRERSLLDWLTPGTCDDVPAARVEALLASIDASDVDAGDADSWLSASGAFRIGRLSGAHHKPAAQFLGRTARESARLARLRELAAERDRLAERRAQLATLADAIRERQHALSDELARAPKDDELRNAHARFSALEKLRREAHERLVEAETQREAMLSALLEARSVLDQDARDLHLPAETSALAQVESALHDYRTALAALFHALDAVARAERELTAQRERHELAIEEVATAELTCKKRQRERAELCARRDLLRETAGAAIADLERRLREAGLNLRAAEEAHTTARDQLSVLLQERARCEQRVHDDRQLLDERSARRLDAVERLRGFTATGLLSVAVPELELPPKDSWSVDPALQLARKVEAQLTRVAAEEHDWTRIQNEVARDYTSLGQALSALGQRTEMDQTDFGMIVQIVYGQRSERPDRLERQLSDEIEQRRGILNAREREVLENHLQAEVAASLQRLMRDAEERVLRINAELKRRPTTTGVYFRLDWETLPEGDSGAPVGLAAARARLLRRVADAWSPDDRRAVGEFLQSRIALQRAQDDSGTLLEHLARALDYRSWHRFRVKRWHDGAFRPLSGPASSGERALGLTVPLFAAVSSYYESSDFRHAPRIVLLDEAFAGIDDEARAHCMALIREFDLDFVMTSEREWGCYATLPGVAICQIIRREGIDGVYVSRWTWDGHARRAERDPDRRFVAEASS